MIEITIGRCLIPNLLKRKGMTQADLAVITGISPTQINGYISGERQSMTLRTAKKIACTLNCSIDDLYEWQIRKL
ncbi:helix-turn-helix transcriptional regulator [Bacillus xiapuensis]|uniref:Helix-turn-helix transcriptional regulator n=1 Tax=Bacillus xiapuensis TaxID=2014075 RepID=A0ABU6N7Z9_9BACI|nr:helix-turn-helix transcriptional regulator [Bacillus xiapuensis]